MTEGAFVDPASHPLAALVAELGDLAERFASLRTWSAGSRELTDQLPELAHHLRAIDATSLGLLGEADRQQVGDPLGFANTVGWWSAVTRYTKSEARHQLKLAAKLDDPAFEATREATRRGDVSLGQASAIVRSLEELPDDLVDGSLLLKAEADLIEFAGELDPLQLRIAGRRILEVHAPEIAEEAERRVLEAEEQRAAETASFTMRPDGHGSMIGRFKIPLVAGRMLEKHLGAIAAPKHQNALAAAHGTIPKPWRWGTAFTEYVETRPTDSIPKAGGIAATVVVTMTLESLLGGLRAAALLDTAEAISASQARRLADEAGIIPAVLGGESEVLDLGRERRFHSRAQRIAIALRDQTCIVEGCDRGPADSHFHHLRPWSQGGRTSVKDGAMICGVHHTQIHDSRYGHDARPHGKIRFYRRT